jgi:hypothetical protein
MAGVPKRGFGSLPAEILLDIAGQLTDLGSLHALLQALPEFRRLTDDTPSLLRLTDLILGLQPKEIQVAVRIHFQLRTNMLAGCDDERNNFLSALILDNPLDRVGPTSQIGSNVSIDQVRVWLAIASHVQWLAQAVLQQCIDNVTNSRPSRLQDASFRYTQDNKGWHERPPGQPHIIHAHALEPPSWIEAQRALRMTWLAHLARERHGLRTERIYEVLGALDREQLYTVREMLDTIAALPSPPVLRPEFAVGSPPEPQFASLKDDVWEQGRRRLGASTSATWLFFTNARNYWRSPLRGATFAPYRKYGFALWDRQRMVRMGFLDQNKARCLLEPDGLFFIWRSLLTAEEDEEVWGQSRIMSVNPLSRTSGVRERLGGVHNEL